MKRLPVVDSAVAASESNGTKSVYPPGEEPRPADGQPTATANHELL